MAGSVVSLGSLCAGALGISACLTPLVRALARRYGVTAKPKADRWHQKPTALLGGISIFAATMLALPLVWTDWSLSPLLLAGTLMFAVGLVDDVIRLNPATKLTAQVAVASLLVFLGFRLDWTSSELANVAVSIVWVVGISNAFNLLDNMDGLCAGVGLIASLANAATLVLTSHATSSSARYAMALAGSLGGFLIFNFPPASIFMGDAGSLFIGTSLAALAMVPSAKTTSGVASTLAVPVLILLIPIFDTTLVSISRKLSGRSASQGGTDHTSHRLVALGFSERDAVLILWTLAVTSAMLAIAAQGFGMQSVETIIGLLATFVVLFGVALAHVRVYEGGFSSLRGRSYTPLLFELTYKRRVFEVLLDLILVATAYLSAYHLRFEGYDFQLFYPVFLKSLPVVLGCQIVSFFVGGVYRGVWRYFSLADLPTYFRSVALASVTTVLAILFLYRFEQFSRAVIIIDAVGLGVLLIASRLTFRFIGETARRERQGRNRVLVYGAGDAGSLLVRELLNNIDYDFSIVGFLDDDPAKANCRIVGFPVLGSLENVESLIRDHRIETIVVSSRKVSEVQLGRLRDRRSTTGTRLMRLVFELDSVSA